MQEQVELRCNFKAFKEISFFVIAIMEYTLTFVESAKNYFYCDEHYILAIKLITQYNV
jgi:hypothetical protein